MTGVCSFPRKLATASDMILSLQSRQEDRCEKVIFDTLQNEVVIGSFGCMPDEWTLSLEDHCAVHHVTHTDSLEAQTTDNFLMRLEPFMRIANGNVEVFNVLNECLTTLYSITEQVTKDNVVPGSFGFFDGEPSLFLLSRKQTRKSRAFLKKRVSCSRFKLTAGDECLRMYVEPSVNC